MSGRPAGTATQAERVLRVFRALEGGMSTLWFAELAAEHGVSERTLRRDLAVVRRVVHSTYEVDVSARAVRLVARGAKR